MLVTPDLADVVTIPPTRESPVTPKPARPSGRRGPSAPRSAAAATSPARETAREAATAETSKLRNAINKLVVSS